MNDYDVTLNVDGNNSFDMDVAQDSAINMALDSPINIMVNPQGSLPTGGSTGDCLLKASDSDYDAEWGTPSGILPTGGSTGKVLKKRSGADFDAEWGTPDGVVPTGGSTSQVLAKRTGANFDLIWVDHNTLPAGGLAGWALVKNSTTQYDAKWAATSLKIQAQDGEGTAPSPSPFAPAQYFSVSGGTFEATASASSAAISESAVSMEYSIKTASDYASSLESVFGTTLSAVFAVDLYFINSSRNEVNPFGTFEYTITNASLASISEPCVVCVTDDGKLFASKGYYSDTNTIAFSSSHVGVFVVTDIASLDMADMTVNVTATRLYAAEDAGYPISVEYGGAIYYAETLFGAYGIYRSGLDLLHLILPVSGTAGKGYLQTNEIHGIPAGGSSGQLLAKSNNSDYSVQWVSAGGGSSDTVVVVAAMSDFVITADHTYAELAAAAAADKPIVLMLNSEVCTSYSVTQNKITFHLKPQYVNVVGSGVTNLVSNRVEVSADGWEFWVSQSQLTPSDIGAGTYSKPSGGIPATDLASAVQTSLGKADTALQSYTETDPTVPSWAKASSKPTYTASEVGAIATPASPTVGDFLVYTANGWAAQSLSTWQGGSY